MQRPFDQSFQDLSVYSHDFSLSSDKKQYHCEKCKLWQQDHLIEEVKFVPQGYISNKKSKKDLQFERKINNNLKQFVHKFSTRQHYDLYAELREKVIKMKRTQPYAKGSRQCAGAVVYFSLQEQIKINFKQYCKQNNLNVKLFHNKVKAYKKLFMKDLPLKDIQSSLEHNYSNIKVEERHQEYDALKPSSNQEQKDPFSNLYPEYSQTLNQKYKIKNEQNIRKALESIYEDIFKGYYYKTKKTTIVKRIIEKISRTNPEVLKTHKFLEQEPPTYYYLIFGVLKSYSFKIYFFQYSKIVKNKTGYSLSKKRAEQAKNIYSQLQVVEDEYPFDNSQMSLSFFKRSVQQNNWNNPPQQFQLVESEPMILKQQCFSCYFFEKWDSSQLKNQF